MRSRFEGFMAIVKREIVSLYKDPDIRILVLIAPLFYSIFYASIYLNKTESDIPVAVVDGCASTLSRKYISDLNAHQLIEVTATPSNISEAELLLKAEKVQGVIVVPNDFEAQLKAGRHATVKVILNTQRFLHSNDINKAVNEIGFEYATESRRKIFALKGVQPALSAEMTEPVNPELRFLFNPVITYGDFLIPGILMLVLQQTLVLGLGMSMAKERQDGHIARWFENAKHSTSAALTGKTGVYFVIFTTYAFFFITFHFSFFSIPSAAPVLQTLVMTALFIFANLSFGVLVGSFFRDKLGVLHVIAFTSYPIFFLTGYAWPDVAFPEALKLLGDLFPLKPFIAAFIKTYRMGADISTVIPELRHLFILAVVYSLLAYGRMRKTFLKCRV